jgi:hypothetical protein
MKNIIYGLTLGALISGCVSNQAVQTIQVGDENKSCDALRAELTQLGAKFEDVKDDSGVTGKNVGLAIVFWPGIIVNEVRANKNQDSIDARITYLTGLYNQKCAGTVESTSTNGTLTERLQELKSLFDQGLISEEEYERSRRRVLEE